MIKARPTDELVFLPLGGSGEIGMNLNAYGYGPPENRKWIIVDIGVTFGNADTPGVDLILPDPEFLAERREDILAIVLTHAHEDHIGALGYLWPRLKAPLYATPFTAYLIREKLSERGLLDKVKLTEIPLGGRFEIGPFDIQLVTLTHSIPEPNGLAIRTPLGLVWHTGDWKIDPEPQIGAATDEAGVTALGHEGVLAMVCDSTNVFVEGEAGSEAGVRDALAELIATKRGKVAITAFASNVARVESAIKAGEAAGRSVCLVGRSMHRIVGAAKSVGLLQDAPVFLSEEEAAALQPERVLYLCTGSQGEPRAALSRIASGEHRNVSLSEGDSVIFSSRVIPGNETSIYALYNKFAERGVEVVTDRHWPIHVSGHPARDELEQMYKWARPRIAVPVHGERRHLLEHVKLARSFQTPEAIAPSNGDLIRLAPGPVTVLDVVPSGRLFLDGETTVAESSDVFRSRRRLAGEGHVSVALVVRGRKRDIVSGPEVRITGLAVDGTRHLDAEDDLADAAEAGFNKLPVTERDNLDRAEDVVMRAVRKAAEKIWRKRPHVEALILEV